MYEIFEQLLKERGITAYRVAKDTGVTTATLTSWKQGKYTPKPEKLQKIADYFNVPLSYLMTGNEEQESSTPVLTSRDERDISKTVNDLMEKLDSKDGAPLFFEGEEMSPETKILFEQQLK